MSDPVFVLLLLGPLWAVAALLTLSLCKAAQRGDALFSMRGSANPPDLQPYQRETLSGLECGVSVPFDRQHGKEFVKSPLSHERLSQ